MADDFSTPSGVKTVYEDTLGYDVDQSLADAKRHAKALRAMLGQVQSSSEGSNQYAWNMQTLGEQLDRCLQWIAANRSQTEAQRKARPAVLHADFSDFGKYDDTVSTYRKRA